MIYRIIIFEIKIISLYILKKLVFTNFFFLSFFFLGTQTGLVNKLNVKNHPSLMHIWSNIGSNNIPKTSH